MMRTLRFTLMPALALLLLVGEVAGCPLLRIIIVRQGSPPVPAQPMPLPDGPAVRPSPGAPPLLAGVLSVPDFFDTFQPRPGKHEVTLLHPFTGQPTPVTFVLPRGKLHEMTLRKRGIQFDFGDRLVTIEFPRNGGVRVEY